jgi:YkoP-like protein
MSDVAGALPAATRPLWTRLIFAIDGFVQRQTGVFEFSNAPDCIFRAQLSRLSENILLADGTFGGAGDRIIDLHFWNEQIPVKGAGTGSLAWGCRFNRSFAKSLRMLADFLNGSAELADVNIIRANVTLEMLDRIAERHGFETAGENGVSPASKRVHEFGENILFWLLVLACNPGGMLPRNFWRHRKLFYLSRRTLDC